MYRNCLCKLGCSLFCNFHEKLSVVMWTVVNTRFPILGTSDPGSLYYENLGKVFRNSGLNQIKTHSPIL